jgi:hydrogenase maturation protease
MAESRFPPHVHILDGGTGGFHLLEYFHAYPGIIMIDATMDGKPPGTVSLLRPRFASDFPRALSAHDIGLRDLIESAMLLGELPEIHLITISVDAVQPMRTELTAAVEASMPEVIKAVHRIVEAMSVT